MLTLAQIAIRVLACFALPLSFGDVVTTNNALAKPGVIEANPLQRFLQRVLGQKWVIARFLFTMASLAAAFTSDGHWLAAVMLLLADALVAYAIWNNIRVGA
jgi:hypothetical protein